MNNKIIIVGGYGQLGMELLLNGMMEGFSVEPLDLPGFDITDSTMVEVLLNLPDVFLVINAAAYTAVDKAESCKEVAFAVNSDGAYNLATACKALNLPLIHLSTDYVFNGDKEEQYIPTDPVSPESVYGKSKVKGEEKIREVLEHHIIIRTSWLFGNSGNNFVKTMLRLGDEKEKISVVCDQYGCPTSAFDLSMAILTIATSIKEKQEIKWGTYHFCNSGITTWFDFAEEIFNQARKFTKFKLRTLEMITTKEYPTDAKRPVKSVLDCQTIVDNFGIIPRPWQESLYDMIVGHYKYNPPDNGLLENFET